MEELISTLQMNMGWVQDTGYSAKETPIAQLEFPQLNHIATALIVLVSETCTAYGCPGWWAILLKPIVHQKKQGLCMPDTAHF